MQDERSKHGIKTWMPFTNKNAYIIINHLNSVLTVENNMDNTSNIAKRIISKLSKFMREFKNKRRCR